MRLEASGTVETTTGLVAAFRIVNRARVISTVLTFMFMNNYFGYYCPYVHDAIRAHLGDETLRTQRWNVVLPLTMIIEIGLHGQ